MRILVISPVFPFPPDDGDRIRIFNILKALKGKGSHKLHLLCFCRPSEEGKRWELKKYFDTVETVKITKPRIIINALRAFFTGEPMNSGAYRSAGMARAVDAAIVKYGAELLYTYRLRMAQYAAGKKIPKVIDFVDSLGLFMERSAKFEPSVFYRLYYKIDGPRVLRYEREMAGKFGAVFINSEEDKVYLGAKNIVTAPNGAIRIRPAAAGKRPGAFTVGFMGNMKYRPNLEAIVYFCKKVWKKLANSDKNIKLVIAGAGSEALGRYAGPSVEIKKFIKDVPSEVGSWDISVAPVKYGAGRQNKVMDAFACGVPVVAAPFAARGVYGRDGFNMLVAASDAEFAEKILRLKADKELRLKLAKNAAATLRKYFDWKKTGKIIDKTIRKLV